MGIQGNVLVAAGVAAAATIAVDQVTKAAVRDSMDVGEEHMLDAGGNFGLAHVNNYGSAYGFVPQMPAWAPVAVMAVLGGGLLLGSGRMARPVLAGAGAGLLIGGAAGNIIDRSRQGYVTDFLRLTPAFGYFNVADVAINGGIGLATAAYLMKRR